MKLFKFTAVIALFAFTFQACEKDKAEPATIVGLWAGKYGGLTNYPTNGYTMLFRSNGTVRVFDGLDTAAASKAEGTYTVTGDDVKTTYTYVGTTTTYSTASKVDSKFTFIEGTWGSGTNTSNQGKYFLNKK